jgi:hypothetical protein
MKKENQPLITELTTQADIDAIAGDKPNFV